jgi:hypothetical protein
MYFPSLFSLERRINGIQTTISIFPSELLELGFFCMSGASVQFEGPQCEERYSSAPY